MSTQQSAAAPRRASPLVGRAHVAAAVAAAALLLRRVDRLACPAAGALDVLLCRAWELLAAPLGTLDLTVGLAAAAGLAALLVVVWAARRLLSKPAVHVLDFAVFDPPTSWRVSRAEVCAAASASGAIPPEGLAFMSKLAFRSGLGDATAVVPAILKGPSGRPGIEAARAEFEAACFPCVEAALAKAGVGPGEVGFVVTASSLFNPTPSLAAMVMNRFKMGGDVASYSLGGMGCSAGVIALDLARQLLQLHPGSVALVVCHENITNNYYVGGDRSMLVANTLFRANGAAVVLTSRPADTARAKYRLNTVVRTNMAADDEAFRCVWQTDDAEGNPGVALQPELISVANRALTAHLTTLGPRVLPWSEAARYGARAALRAALRALPPKAAARLPAAWSARPTPNFGAAFDVACIHTGGRGVIDSVEASLGFSRAAVEASRAALFRFGNTSSCSVWYELAYAETFGAGVPAGARVWQLAFGSGFKVNSAMLVAARRVADAHPAWAGFDRDQMYSQLALIDAEVAASRARRAAEKAAAAEPTAAAAAAAVAAACAAAGGDATVVISCAGGGAAGRAAADAPPAAAATA